MRTVSVGVTRTFRFVNKGSPFVFDNYGGLSKEVRIRAEFMQNRGAACGCDGWTAHDEAVALFLGYRARFLSCLSALLFL